MVDEERIARLLDRVVADVRTLRSYRDDDGDLQNNPTILAAVKYHFITAIEGCARVAHHIAAASEWPAAESNADAIRRLAAEQVVGESTARSVAMAVGFRNVLVHAYADVDDSHVLTNLDEVGDLEDFAAQIAAWVSDSSSATDTSD